ncbi:putative acyl-CoA dehydrogenase AidB [mine drainage metagenome]|uniref:Putative acyl-CoA dehydrogenase AidB n=1 Tax=mine drainage metagenome TaxID=410659 RepID=A0A1J5RBK2_9ZZZZ
MDATSPDGSAPADGMEAPAPQARWLAETHEVFNVGSELAGYDLYRSDQALVDAVHREGAGWADAELAAFGRMAGAADYLELGVLANHCPPELDTHDRFGRRIDLVRYHPAYHALMRSAIGHGLHASPWAQPRGGAHVARAAALYMQSQVDAGHICPVTMTFAAVPALRATPALAAQWEARITAPAYDPRNVPAQDKAGLTVGMAMTEKQGGSDVRANTTRAYPLGAARGAGATYELVGHKYFVSAPMCDAFLVLAQAPAGLSCFLLPRWRPDGSKNPLQLLRLKRKMGNVSNASSETELRGALAWMVGDEGRGVRTIIEMVAMTRFDCMVASAAAQRAAVALALHHCARREAFGRRLIEQPAMRNVLADLALEHEGALALAMRVARALDSRRRARGRAAAAAHSGGQILGLQAHAAARGRGDGVHRRQRRDGRRTAGAALPRSSGQCDLGRQRQRAVPRRAARDAAYAGRGRRAVRRAGRGARRRPPARPLGRATERRVA